MTDSFLPDPDRRISDADEELAHEVPGDGPDYFEGNPDSSGDDTDTAEASEPLHPNPLFRTPHAGERLTEKQLEADLDD